jgi:hypothetical protein
MKCQLNILKKCVTVSVGALFTCQLAFADPVWHCSRSEIQIANASDDFTLASLELEREVIRLSLRDLYAVYQGTPIKMSGGLPLSACVIEGSNANLTHTALQSVGVQPATTRALTGGNALMKSHIHAVPDESSMLACITKHHPAIGYLSRAMHTEAVGPCF